MSTIIYPVHDLDQAKTLFGRLLGAEPTMDEPYYVGFDRDGEHVASTRTGTARGSPARSVSGTWTTSTPR